MSAIYEQAKLMGTRCERVINHINSASDCRVVSTSEGDELKVCALQRSSA